MVKRKTGVASKTESRQKSGSGKLRALPPAQQPLQSPNKDLSDINDDLSRLLTSVNIPIVLLGSDLCIRRFTPMANRVFHLTHTDLGRPVTILQPYIEVSDLEKRVAEVIKTRSIQKHEVQDREGRWYTMWLRPYRTAQNRIDGAVIALADINEIKLRLEQALANLQSSITEREQAEEEFRQSQKMEALGRLAGGLAHDFNNLLTAIGGLSEILLEDTEADDPRRGQIQEINEAAYRAVALTRKVLAFSRRQMVQVEVLDLNTLITDLSKMIRPLIGDDIELRLSLALRPQLVSADASQLEQVILNLAANARDASPLGGRLTIQTEPAGRADSQVALIVSDTGTGMDVQTQSHLFEPFFTTKPRGQGTGLGLSAVYGIVQQGGGQISVLSEVGRGTSFTILLPRASGLVTGSKAAEQPAPRGSETILIVEDEAAVRGLTRRVLARAGYAVLEAGGAAEAIRISQRHSGAIHLVLSDLGMPGLDGSQLSGRLTALRPDIRVLLMSGYSQEMLHETCGLLKSTDFLPKPFTRANLLRKVRDVLDSPVARGVSQ